MAGNFFPPKFGLKQGQIWPKKGPEKEPVLAAGKIFIPKFDLKRGKIWPKKGPETGPDWPKKGPEMEPDLGQILECKIFPKPNLAPFMASFLAKYDPVLGQICSEKFSRAKSGSVSGPF